MAKKLFRVPLSMVTVVYADDWQQAMAIADAEASDFQLEAEHADELFLDKDGKIAGLPEGWGDTDIPLGAGAEDDDEEDKTLADIAEEMRAQKAKANNLELPLGTKT